MSVTVTLPVVSTCNAMACTYNANSCCHAPAITVGDAMQPICVTSMPDRRHVTPQPVAGVGACKVDDCVYNRERSCHAPAIDVVMRGQHPDCATFKRSG